MAVFLQTDDLKVRLVTLSILEKVGGDETVKELQAFATTQIDQTLKAKALNTVATHPQAPQTKAVVDRFFATESNCSGV